MKSLEGKRVLLTGNSGFIGTHLLENLSDIPDIQIVCTGRTGNNVCSTPNDVTYLDSRLEELSKEDLLNAGGNDFDYVFHLAAFMPKNKDQTNSSGSIVNSNICGTQNLLELVSIRDRLIFASTVDVYNVDKQIIDESTCTNPVSLYGSSKLFCEHLLKIDSSNKKYKLSILRFGHVFGPGEDRFQKLIPVSIIKSLQNESLEVWGNPKLLRDFIYVDDVVEACIRSSVLQTNDPVTVNIVSGKSYEIREIVEKISHLTNTSKEIKYINSNEDGISYRFSNKKMKEILGDWAMIDFERGLANEVSSIRERIQT